MPEETSPLNLFGWPTDYLQDSSYGKTSPEYYRPAKDGTLVPSSGRWRSSGMGSAGEFVTRNIGESPKDAVVSSLLPLLEEMSPSLQEYCLTRSQCQSILDRAARRGKMLPPSLKQALELAISNLP